jgi:hypothetical protein
MLIYIEDPSTNLKKELFIKPSATFSDLLKGVEFVTGLDMAFTELEIRKPIRINPLKLATSGVQVPAVDIGLESTLEELGIEEGTSILVYKVY